jgi:hypothetical protein
VDNRVCESCKLANVHVAHCYVVISTRRDPETIVVCEGLQRRDASWQEARAKLQLPPPAHVTLTDSLSLGR